MKQYESHLSQKQSSIDSASPFQIFLHVNSLKCSEG